MWRFVNLYLLLFLLDSIASLADDVAALAFNITTLHPLRGVVALLPFIFSFPLYFLAGSTRGFPKKIILPMAMFQIWCGVFLALPVPIYLGMQHTNLILSTTQLLLSMAAFTYLRQKTKKRTWFYTEFDFHNTTFNWKRTLGFAGVNAVIAVPFFTVYLAWCASLAASHLSRGFIVLDTSGIFVESRTYTYQGRTLYLLPTFHVAEASFYRSLLESLPESNTAVLLEGVTDNQGLLKPQFSYRKLADKFKLTMQDNRIFSTRHAVQRCDVDVSQFSPQTRLFLNAVARSIQRWFSDNPLTALTEGMSSPKPDPKLLWQDLVELRNRRLLNCMQRVMQTYDNLLIPWGAAHMPGLEEAFFKWGATLTHRRRIRVLSW
jgi:hypothetical protein